MKKIEDKENKRYLKEGFHRSDVDWKSMANSFQYMTKYKKDIEKMKISKLGTDPCDSKLARQEKKLLKIQKQFHNYVPLLSELQDIKREMIDWSNIVDDLIDKKKITFRMTDHENRDDARQILSIENKPTVIDVDCLGHNPDNKTFVKFENKLIKLYQKYNETSLIPYRKYSLPKNKKCKKCKCS